MLKIHGLYGAILRFRQITAAFLVIGLTLCAIAGAQAQNAPKILAPKILALGDSLTAGYNLPADAAFPKQLEAALRKDGIQANVINAGVSGDTTTGALGRVDWALADKPTHAIVALGANDMLRGLSPEAARANMEKIIVKLQQAGVKVMLAGMLAAPNLGADYAARFNPIYPDLAKQYGLTLYPFFLDGVAGQPALNLSDGIHPTREGVAEMVKRMLPQVKAWLAG